MSLDTDIRRETRTEDRIGFWEKTALGLGMLPFFFGQTAVASFAIPVYQMTLKIAPSLLALALTLPRFWDAFIDPIVGRASDNFRSRWGRRKPFIVVGAFLQAVAFGFIWMVPKGWSELWTVSYLIVSLLVFYACYSVYSVPLVTLGYEMTADYQERTRVSAFSAFFGKAGEFLYQWIFPLTSLAIFASVMQGVRVVGWVVGIFIMGLVGVIPGLFVKERYFKRAAQQEKVRIWPSLKASFQNRAFVVLVALTILQIVAGMLASNIDYYLLVYYMSGGHVAHGAIWKGVLSTGYAVLGIGLIYPATWLANKYGKHTTLAFAFGLVLIGAVGKWVLFTPGHDWSFTLPLFFRDPVHVVVNNNWKILIDPLFCGPVWIAINMLTPSMLADVCDDDELRHGQRREGVFGAIFSWIQKTGYSLAFFGAMSSLQLTGFNAELGGAQTPGTFLGLRLILTISTAVWAIGALALILFYPLTRKRAYEIRDQLEARRGRIVT
jgi:GPH family glycoside/pentoside/hexuronide:cation symporter